MRTRKIGRDAITGRFVSINDTLRRPSTTTVETMKVGRSKGRRGRRW